MRTPNREWEDKLLLPGVFGGWKIPNQAPEYKACTWLAALYDGESSRSTRNCRGKSVISSRFTDERRAISILLEPSRN